MYFYVNLLVKLRYCEKATNIWEKINFFANFCVLFMISELVSNGLCFFLSIYCIVVVLFAVGNT